MNSEIKNRVVLDNSPIGIKSNGIPYSVFLIDDSLTAREILKRILLSLQFKIVGEATNGELALTMLKSESINPDFIFVDMEMPQMNGIETIKLLKPLRSDAKIIMVTSHTERSIVEDSMKLSICGYIRKPFDRDTIVKKMARQTGREIPE